jgi:hypothetical protein
LAQETVGAVTPVQAVERGLPLARAMVMRPDEMTREDVEKLLAANVMKREIARLYGFRSTKMFYRKLTELGLHKPAPAPVKRAAKDGRRLSVGEAQAAVRRLEANIECCERVLSTALTKDVYEAVYGLRREYKAELSRITEALGRTKIVV